MSLKRALGSRIRETLTISGMLLILISLLLGVAIPLFASPRLALSTHLTGVQGGMMLMVFGLVWRKVSLGNFWQHISCWFVLLGTWLVWAGNLLGAVYATGKLTPIAGAGQMSSPRDEWIVAGVLGGGSTLLVLGIVVLLFGLMRNREQAIVEARGR